MRIEVKNISKTYDLKYSTVEALKSINLLIEEGEYVAVCGVSGSGKSTLLNMIGCLDKPSTGKIMFDDINIVDLSESERADIRNSRIGFVFQDYALIQYRTVAENVYMPLYLSSIPRKEHKRMVQEAARKVGIEEMLKRKVYTLSGGQKQRVAIARALVCNPELILADEPTGSLDEGGKEEIRSILKGISESGKTVIVVTHDKTLAFGADRIVNIRNGRTD
ncbi:MAG: ABC transporter ATP-binding protein [Clostridiales bacterium]|nr:ABC transporter ATP-binding protein [Clostridiales bacterium]